MVRVSCFGKSVAMFAVLVCALLLDEILAYNSHGKLIKQERYDRRHNHRRYDVKRSVDNNEQDQVARSANRRNYEFFLNTTCGDVLCDSAVNYPQEAIMAVVKKLHQIHESSKASFTEEIDPLVMKFISEYVQTVVDLPEMIYEESKGCKSFGNVSYPQEGYSNDDGQIYYVVNVPNFLQKANRLTCKRSMKECGDNNIKLPTTFFRTCQQVDREDEFLVLPSNRSQYRVHDFRVRTFLVPDGCKCILLNRGGYEFVRQEAED